MADPTDYNNTGRKQGSSMYESDASAIPSLPGSSHEMDLTGGASIPLQFLPAGTKQGDTVTLKVAYVDAGQGMAKVVKMDSDQSSDEGSDQDKNGTGSANSTIPQGGVNTGTLLGPMSGLKGYLIRKQADVQSQIS